ncbi:MAG: tyrosine-type recombinase/integrase [Pseudomonas sp.]|nr:tyrosine-type recombinase/integrase [Pseudomonas sp.]
MKAKLTLSLLNGLATTGSAYEVHDSTVTGLFVRVTAAGKKAYVVRWARGKKKTLGRVGIMTHEQARKEAIQYIAEANKHGEPLAVSQARKVGGMPTLEAFMVDHFEPWAEAHHRDAVNGARAIRKSFADLLQLPLDEIDARLIERLRTAWLTAGLAPASANRNMTRLRGVLTRAVEWGVLEVHPLVKVKRLKVDRRGRVRYLTPDEEKALRQAMADREAVICAERDSANEWRRARKKELMPDLGTQYFADHLRPLVVTSINTGMRRGEVFNLTWTDIDLKNKIITVEGVTSKSGQTRHIPMNKEVAETLTRWNKQSNGQGFVFPGKDGKRIDNVTKSWAGLLALAKIEAFRWHDLRHTFASKLVMAGVPLNTVRELLGHSDLTMTLRYAHLAPDSKASAVELI